ncbi:MAG: ABC-three component system protein [Candidatus Omnitrophota bacterium]
MISNAPGQFLGYAIQFTRALYHLLKSGPGDYVCVEYLGDVAIQKVDSKIITEEDKSSIKRNPLTDKSADLWKTFYNWIMAVKNKELDIEKTQFLLFCNKEMGKNSIVNKFNLAKNETEASFAVKKAKEKLNDINQDHDIWKYFNYSANQNEFLLVKIIEKFEIQIGSGAGDQEVIYEIKRKHVPKSQIEFIKNFLMGWLYKQINEKIAANNPAIISWEEFDRQFTVLFDRARKRELLDFTLQDPLKDEEKQDHFNNHPIYLKQLEKIDVFEDELWEAVSDFLKANVNRHKWIEEEIIDEITASDFEDKLIRFWNSQKKKIDITQKGISEIEQGSLLYNECKSRQETIRGEPPPSSTIPGTYHALANKLDLGWHPNWKKIFPKEKG